MTTELLQQVFGFNYAGFNNLLLRSNMCSASKEEMHNNVNKLIYEYSKTHKSKRTIIEITEIMHAMIDEWFN